MFYILFLKNIYPILYSFLSPESLNHDTTIFTYIYFFFIQIINILSILYFFIIYMYILYIYIIITHLYKFKNIN